MKKIRAAIIGYGNIGKYTLEALRSAPDFEVAGVIRRNISPENIPLELTGVSVTDHIEKLAGVDVAVLSSPTRQVESLARDILALGINTVDSYDIHSSIWDLKQNLDPVAVQNNAVSIIAAGWDPGSDSVVRALMMATSPKGITYTNFGPGMSMGHTVAAKAVPGVREALSMTIPLGTGIHRRIVYIELEKGYLFDQVAEAIGQDDYFRKDETHIIEVADVDLLKDMGHGVHMIRKGVSGSTDNQILEFKMKINNPALTAQILVGCARATMRMTPGAYTMIEVPVVHLLHGDKEELIRQLV